MYRSRTTGHALSDIDVALRNRLVTEIIKLSTTAIERQRWSRELNTSGKALVDLYERYENDLVVRFHLNVDIILYTANERYQNLLADTVLDIQRHNLQGDELAHYVLNSIFITLKSLDTGVLAEMVLKPTPRVVEDQIRSKLRRVA